MKLLVIDDGPLVLVSMRAVLARDRHTVVQAKGGREGIDAFQVALAEQQPFDAVITDLGMPHVDGMQVARAVKARSPETPVVLSTGWGQRMAESEQPLADVDFALAKPPRLAELRSVLSQISLGRS